MDLEKRKLEEDQLLAVYNNIYLYKIGYSNLKEFSNFVFQKYAYHYNKKYGWEPEEIVAEEMYKSDVDQFKDSVYLGFRDIHGRLLGTIKVSERNHQKFSIEKDFDIVVDELITTLDFPVNSIWHLGRLAIASDVLKANHPDISSRQVIQHLLIHSLQYIASDPEGLMLAESDVLIHKIFDELGLYMEIIGEKKEFLGSPTYPVLLTSKTIRKWLSSQIEHQIK
ncbi:hypothetical protein [Tenacibaculum amylolyticum]|uniref:hypothetical protein n=1 Tax=Tenacibaculum amylolyticum TaxID=104269 RepID=UPI003894060A